MNKSYDWKWQKLYEFSSRKIDSPQNYWQKKQYFKYIYDWVYIDKYHNENSSARNTIDYRDKNVISKDKIRRVAHKRNKHTNSMVDLRMTAIVPPRKINRY